MAKVQIQFDGNLSHQRVAIQSVLDVFEGLPRFGAEFRLGEEFITNLPEAQDLNEPELQSNVQKIQERNIRNDEKNDIRPQSLFSNRKLESKFEVVSEKTLPVFGGKHEEHSHFPFTIEMETGTGKTYVYLRTVYELAQKYGFTKFLVVVPSIAIFEGVRKNFEMAKEHLSSLIRREDGGGLLNVNLVPLNTEQLSQLRSFATSADPVILLTTIDSFNKVTNKIFKANDKLPGELLPFEYISRTRPILILDEPQNYTTQIAKSAIATMRPLVTLHYSATPKETKNLLYRLSPLQAFRYNLVKKIEVIGVQDDPNPSVMHLRLLSVEPGPVAKFETKTVIDGEIKLRTVELTERDVEQSLFEKTGIDLHKDFVLLEIEYEKGRHVVRFTNGETFHESDYLGTAREEIFRVQIRETIDTHFRKQNELRLWNVKVLSLFFIDRVAHYVSPDPKVGFIRRIFDEEYKAYCLRSGNSTPKFEGSDVREAYFAKSKKSKTENERILNDEELESSLKDKDVQKRAFELIMKDKDRLLSFDEPVAFIFAHSALSEGWDNPNVFQICTLVQTRSQMRKRQIIGRGLRLAVNQNGERNLPHDLDVLTVIANESYETFANELQNEYSQDGEKLDTPPVPSNARKEIAKRNEDIVKMVDFQDFFEILVRRYNIEPEIKIDTPKLIEEANERFRKETFERPSVQVTRGSLQITKYKIKIFEASEKSQIVNLDIQIESVNGWSRFLSGKFRCQSFLCRKSKDRILSEISVRDVSGEGQNAKVWLNHKEIKMELKPGDFYECDTFINEKRADTTIQETKHTFPVQNIIQKVGKETGLTFQTVMTIYKELRPELKDHIFNNPDGFVIFLSRVLNEVLAKHISERVEFIEKSNNYNLSVDDLFPKTLKFVQRRIAEPGKESNSLYSIVPIDSDTEHYFWERRLHEKEKVVAYFKFPSNYRIDFPKVIGNYNPDWGVIYENEKGQTKLKIVRETKGTANIENLQHESEKNKIACAKRFFEKLQIPYRVIDQHTEDWARG